MACRIFSIPIDCARPDALAEFWAEVLGWDVTKRGFQKTDHGRDGAVISAPGGGPFEIDFRWVPDAGKQSKNRLHFDLNPTDRDQTSELDRLLGMGATRVDIGQGQVDWFVLADPEGNEFCLCRSRIAP